MFKGPENTTSDCLSSSNKITSCHSATPSQVRPPGATHKATKQRLGQLWGQTTSMGCRPCRKPHASFHRPPDQVGQTWGLTTQGISPACTLTRAKTPVLAASRALPHWPPLICLGYQAWTSLCRHPPCCNNVKRLLLKHCCNCAPTMAMVDLQPCAPKITSDSLLQQWPWITVLPLISLSHL
jgi:hypothetical protein